MAIHRPHNKHGNKQATTIFLHKLLIILAGERDLAWAGDNEMHYEASC